MTSGWRGRIEKVGIVWNGEGLCVHMREMGGWWDGKGVYREVGGGWLKEKRDVERVCGDNV